MAGRSPEREKRKHRQPDTGRKLIGQLDLHIGPLPPELATQAQQYLENARDQIRGITDKTGKKRLARGKNVSPKAIERVGYIQNNVVEVRRLINRRDRTGSE